MRFLFKSENKWRQQAWFLRFGFTLPFLIILVALNQIGSLGHGTEQISKKETKEYYNFFFLFGGKNS